jgi:hypothetical protein
MAIVYKGVYNNKKYIQREGTAMSTYKNFLNAARLHCNSSGLLRFLLSGRAVIFALGGLFYLLGAFLINLDNVTTGYAIYDAFTAVGVILAVIGVIFCIVADDAMAQVVISSVISAGALAAFIVLGATGKFEFIFYFGPLFYFLVFGAIVLITVLKSEKFKEMRAAAAARAQVAVIPCPKCGAFMPMMSSFCPTCGAQSPVIRYAPPAQPQYAPPVQPQAYPAETAVMVKCISCGADIPQGVGFCPACGAKQV